MRVVYSGSTAELASADMRTIPMAWDDPALNSLTSCKIIGLCDPSTRHATTVSRCGSNPAICIYSAKKYHRADGPRPSTRDPGAGGGVWDGGAWGQGHYGALG